MTDQKLREAQMQFSSASSIKPHFEDAINEVIAQIERQMQGLTIDFAQVFLTPHFRVAAPSLAKKLQATLAPKVLIGCTAESVIDRHHEIEQIPAITLVAAHLPEIEIVPFKLQTMNWTELLEKAEAFQKAIPVPDHTKLFVLLCDPFTTPVEQVLNAFNTFHPNLPMIGGLASGSHRPGGNVLFFNDSVINNGAVGVAFAGPLEVDIIVSQGCRPVGRPFTVTSVRENVVQLLEGEAPLKHLQRLISDLSSEDQDLLQHGLFIGRAINPNEETLGRGDFLIRGVMGLDRENGAMIVNDHLSQGEKIQFHLRDANTAAEDLEMMLTPQMLYDPPAGAFLFSCNGRGTRLFDYPDGDISTLRKVVGEVNLAGFFCAGEIGPVGGKNFLHGHTASLALFRPMTIEENLR